MMSNNIPTPTQPQTVYQADPTFIQSMQAMKANVIELSKQCIHRPVRVQMVEGQQLEGTVVHLDSQYIYLKVEMNSETMRQPYNPYYNPYNSSVILPLVLYELLVITLLL
jgi:small nuclear ribonucleoprotein (snRNP)-like protein